MAKPCSVLAIFVPVLVLFAVGCVLVAAIGHVALRRLGLELWSVLMWLGLAEDPRHDRRARDRAGPQLTVVHPSRP